VQIAPIDRVTYKITAIYFILPALFGLLLQLFITCKIVMTLGLAEPLNYSLSMPPGWLSREMGDAEAFCGS